MPERREVDEPTVEVLHDHAQALELLDAAGDLLRLALELLLEGARLLRVEVATVARDPPHELRLPGRRNRHRSPVRDELLRHGPNLTEQGICLLGREMPLRHPSIIARRVRRSTRSRAAGGSLRDSSLAGAEPSA